MTVPNPRSILIVNTPPADSPGKFVMVVGRGPGPPHILFMDRLAGVEKDKQGRYAAYEVHVGKKVIARFPGDTPYIMMERGRTELLTPAEAATANKIEREAVEAVWGHTHGDEGAGEVVEIPASLAHPGNYL